VRERERERTYSVKTPFRITMELGLKNRNPLFPELETLAVCAVVIRVWEKEKSVTRKCVTMSTFQGLCRWWEERELILAR